MGKKGLEKLSIKLGPKPPKTKASKVITVGDMVVRCAHTDIADIRTLVRHPSNPNRHPKEQIELLAEIMKFQGVRLPITLSNRSGFMTKGHGRLEAAILNGWKQFPVDRQDYVSEAQEYADLAADNKIQELSFTDSNALKDLMLKMPQGFNMKMMGMTPLAIDTLLKGWDPDKVKMDGIDPNGNPLTPRIIVRCTPKDIDPIRAFLKTTLKEQGWEVTVE